MNIIKHAYIDESGSPDLDDQRFYVITAAICRSDDLDNITVGIRNISCNRCGGAFLKSSRTGKNENQRKKILADLSELPLFYFSCVVDKSNIKMDSGLQWRTSMYKFCQKMLFDRIYKNLQSIRIVSDTFGKSNFMISFEKYIDKHFPTTLFTNKSFCHATPENEIVIQAADFVGGSILRCFEGKDKNTILDHVKDKIIGIHKWPLSHQEIIIGEQDELIDISIRNHCFFVAEKFIEQTDDTVLKEVCRFLLYDHSSIVRDFIYGDELLMRLKKQGIIDEKRDKNWLMQKVIAPLRDCGVLISACRDGYKIPDSREDIAKFVKFVETKSYPYLSRLVKMRESIFLGTNTKYDLVIESDKLSNILKSVNG